MKRAVKMEAIKVVEVTIGTGLMNSPIMPDVSRSGMNAQTVVMVVVKTGIRKSFQTNSAVWIGLNLPTL